MIVVLHVLPPYGSPIGVGDDEYGSRFPIRVGGDRACVVGGDGACVVGSEGEFWRVEATPVVFRGCFG